MLFHVTMTHDAAHCPGFHRGLAPKLIEAVEKREETAKRCDVKIHSFLSAAPEHFEILIAEAESSFDIAMLVSQLYPFELAQIDVKAVNTMDEVVAKVKQMMSG